LWSYERSDFVKHRIKAGNDGVPTLHKPELFQDVPRCRVLRIGARSNGRHLQPVEPVIDYGAGDLAAIAVSNVVVCDTVEQLELRRVAKEPEAAKTDNRVAGSKVSEPESEGSLPKQADASLDNISGPLPRDNVVVEDHPPDAWLREDVVKLRAVLNGYGPQGQSRALEHHRRRTRSVTMS